MKDGRRNPGNWWREWNQQFGTELTRADAERMQAKAMLTRYRHVRKPGGRKGT